jgi:CRP-like cAMP-binding protein
MFTLKNQDIEIVKKTIFKYLVSNQTLLNTFLQLIESQEFSDGELIDYAGNKVDKFYIITSGTVRYYYTMLDGKERNKAFFTQGQFIGSLSAYLTNQTIPFSIQALGEVRLYKISIEMIEAIKKKYPTEVELFIGRIAKELFIRNEQREAMLLTTNAEQRYQWVLSNEPWIVDHVAQYHLASYLGIEAESLSRIKKKFM